MFCDKKHDVVISHALQWCKTNKNSGRLFTKLLTVVILGSWKCRWWFYFFPLFIVFFFFFEILYDWMTIMGKIIKWNYVFCSFLTFQLEPTGSTFSSKVLWGQQFSNFIVHQVLFKRFWCIRSRVTFRMCICDKFLGSADAAGLDTTLCENHCSRVVGVISWVHIRNLQSLFFFKKIDVWFIYHKIHYFKVRSSVFLEYS